MIGYVDRNRRATGKHLTNTASLLAGGRILHTQAKTLLPTYDVFDEARYFEPAAERRIVEFKGERIGLTICEDIWWETEPDPAGRYAVDPVRDCLDQGATLLVAPSASPYYRGKPRVRRRLLARIGAGAGVPVVYVNMVGGNDRAAVRRPVGGHRRPRRAGAAVRGLRGTAPGVGQRAAR